MYFEILSDGDVSKWEQLENLQVSVALTKLSLEKDKKDYQKELQKIQLKKMEAQRKRNKNKYGR